MCILVIVGFGERLKFINYIKYIWFIFNGEVVVVIVFGVNDDKVLKIVDVGLIMVIIFMLYFGFR